MTTDDYPLVGEPTPLLIKHLLDRVRHWAPDQQIVYRDLRTFTYREFLSRTEKLARVLASLGVGKGVKVGVLDYDSHRYLECFFAVPMIGAVLHTVNMRLTPEQLAYTVDHAEDEVVLVHADFAPAMAAVRDRLPKVRHWVLLKDHDTPQEAGIPWAGEYEALLEGVSAGFAFPDFDEASIATLFYTTGTTGHPKGVFFSHRQIVLHSLTAGMSLSALARPLRFSADDVYMPLTPMFHVHAWGVPYLTTALGNKQVYPGRYEPTLLFRLIQEHGVTFSHCVTSILQLLLHHPAGKGVDLSRLTLIIGGGPLPLGVAQQARDRGIRVVGGYGMSETCPIVAVSHVQSHVLVGDGSADLDRITRTGFPLPMVRAEIWSPEGRPLPPGSGNVGELVLQAPWLTRGYYKEPELSRQLWRGGWLHTGDIAYRDDDGYVRITDRLKDVIKISGEWISSIEIENVLSQHPGVREVAVIGIPDPRWEERPAACVVLTEQARGSVSERDLSRFLHGFVEREAIHKRALLTEFRIVESLPRTSVGKVDKKKLRAPTA